ncbi:hypothetical protein THRCLA_05508, partial [Thraustotheca clavata]
MNEAEVRHVAGRGRGLYAISKLDPNQVVLKDSPISVANTLEEAGETERLVCCVCKRFVGSIQLQLHYLAGNFRLDSSMCDESKQLQSLPEHVKELAISPILPQVPSPTEIYLTKYPGENMPCVICSQTCCDILHAQPTNVFGIAYQQNEQFQKFEAQLNHLTLVTSILARIFAKLVAKCDWNKAVADFIHLEVCPSMVKMVDRELLKEAYDFVMASFITESAPKEVSLLFKQKMDLAFFSSLLGIAKVNAVGIDVPSPIVPYFLSCEGDPNVKAQLVEKAAVLLEQVLQNLCHHSDGEDASSSAEDDDSNDDEDEEDQDNSQIKEERMAENSDDEDEDIHFVWSTEDDGGCDIEFNSSAFPSMDGAALFPNFSML